LLQVLDLLDPLGDPTAGETSSIDACKGNASRASAA
jgi:hypothetical protein